VGGEPITVDQPLDPVRDGGTEVPEKNIFRLGKAVDFLLRNIPNVRRAIPNIFKKKPVTTSPKPPAPSPTTVSISEKDANHIFRKSPGHVPLDRPANRQLLINTASNPKNYLGVDKYGTQW